MNQGTFDDVAVNFYFEREINLEGILHLKRLLMNMRCENLNF